MICEHEIRLATHFKWVANGGGISDCLSLELLHHFVFLHFVIERNPTDAEFFGGVGS